VEVGFRSPFRNEVQRLLPQAPSVRIVPGGKVDAAEKRRGAGGAVHRARVQGLGEGIDVEPVVALAIALDVLVGGNQKGTGRIAIADHVPQVGEGLVEVSARGALGSLRPQEASQAFPAVRDSRLDRQVGEQRAYLVGIEPRDRLSIQRRLKGPQKGEAEACHRVVLPLTSPYRVVGRPTQCGVSGGRRLGKRCTAQARS
jgi:hypothetical protein